MLFTASIVVAGLIILSAVLLGIRTTILKAPSTHPNPPYSFARVQLMWWTVIVGACFIVLYGRTGDYDLINQSTLILLSIGLVTTAGGSVIDASQQKTVPVRHQDGESKGFIMDILSDNTGVSMHRFQALMFNILFGITFIATFWMKEQFPEFNTSELALMGVSSGAYLALKTNENKHNTAAATTTKADTP